MIASKINGVPKKPQSILKLEIGISESIHVLLELKIYMYSDAILPLVYFVI